MNRIFFSKKIILDESQFSLYKLEINLKKLWIERMKIKNFISSEMEKNHPRFSVQCEWEYFFTIKEKKLFANVIVVDKLLLAKYMKSKRPRFYISSPKRQIFTPKSHMIMGVLLTSLILIIGCTFGVKQDFENKQKELIEPVVEKKLEYDNQTTLVAEERIDVDFCTFFSEFFEKLYEENTELFLDSFSFEVNQSDEKINFAVLGVYPEKIKNNFEKFKVEKNISQDEILLKIDSVSYENEKVKTKVCFLKKKTSEDFSDLQNQDYEDFLISFRNNLILTGIFPSDENLENHSLSFFVKKQDFENLISNYEFKSEKVIKNIITSSTFGEEKIFCEIVFLSLEEKFHGFSFEEVFSEKLINALCKQDKTKKLPVKIEKKVPVNDSLEIIGKITLSSGEKVVLVKDKNGKIIQKPDK